MKRCDYGMLQDVKIMTGGVWWVVCFTPKDLRGGVMMHMWRLLEIEAHETAAVAIGGIVAYN